MELNTAVFATKTAWRKYAVDALQTAERVAGEIGIQNRLHLWPDAKLGSKEALRERNDPVAHEKWLQDCWNRISEWPQKLSLNLKK